MGPTECWRLYCGLGLHLTWLTTTNTDVGERAMFVHRRWQKDDGMLFVHTPHELRQSLRKAAAALDLCTVETKAARRALLKHPFMVLFLDKYDLAPSGFDQARELYMSQTGVREPPPGPDPVEPHDDDVPL